MNNLYIFIILAYVINLYANYYMSEKIHLKKEKLRDYSLTLSLSTILILYIVAFSNFL
jgi:hypothetical protein